MTSGSIDASVSSWSLESFCEMQHYSFASEELLWKDLPWNSRQFMYQLGLPSAHPFCTHPDQFLVRPMAPPMGPPSDDHFFKEASNNVWDAIITAFWYHVPPVAALAYLFIALLAIYIAPLGLLMLLGRLYSKRHQKEQEGTWNGWTELLFHGTFFLSWLILTDDQYVMGIGRSFGAILVSILLVVASMITFTKIKQGEFSTNNNTFPFPWRVLLVLLVGSVISPWGLYDPEEFPTKVEPGIYFNHDNISLRQIVHRWRQTLPDYSHVATPWQFTGDARTGLPYLMNRNNNLPEGGAALTFHRVWLPTDDNEYVALDIAFPTTGHNASNPLYLVLHGLNGGSEEGYVRDLATARTQVGSTVVVMVARGLMNTPIQGWTFFNGIRVMDVHTAASTLRERVLAPKQTLAGVGYSMGGIVLNRYVSTSEAVALDVSVSISGALCTLYQKDYHRSQRTWQRVITGHMKEMFFRGKWGNRLYRVLGFEGYRDLLRAQDIVGTDYYAGALYNGYDNITHFYTEMSSILPYRDRCLDISTNRKSSTRNDSTSHRRIPIPHLVLQALDDPLSTWRSNAADDPNSALYPSNLISAQDNIVLLLTSKGGHVGWPIGLWPNSWAFMNDYVAARFVTAYDEYRHKDEEDLRPIVYSFGGSGATSKLRPPPPGERRRSTS